MAGVTTHASSGMIKTRNGIRIIPDRQGADWPETRRITTFPGNRPAEALERTLAAITARYGTGTADVVAMQLEYPR